MSGSGAMYAKHAEKRRQRNERRGILALLGFMIILATAFALMVPAISMTKGDMDAQQTDGSSIAAQAVDDEASSQEASQDDAASEAEAAMQGEEPGEEAAAVDGEGDAASGDGADAADDATNDASAGEGDESGEGEDPAASDTDGAAAASDPAEGTEDSETAEDPETAADTEDAPMPAQSFYGELRDKNDKVTLAVDVDAPEGALPEGTTMQVAPVKAKEIQDAVQAALEKEDAGKVDEIQAVDITFLNADGEEVEPAVPVNVRFTSKQIAKAAKADQQPLVAHIDDKGKAELVEQLSDDELESRDLAREANELLFDADAFSVYAVVYTVEITADVMTADGETYTVTVECDQDAGIPEGSELNVREIQPGTDEYQGYLNDSATKLDVKSEEISFARFFDIEITHNGEKIEPLAPVKVSISYDQGLEEGKDVNVIHFADQGIEVIDDVMLNDDGAEIVYEQGSFSVTGTIQTGNPTNGGIYMVLVEYNGKHYMVNNDGTLTEALYGQDAAGHNDPTKVTVEFPMLWTYYYEYGGHLRYASEASGFTPGQIASGYYYRYIDPNSDSGLIEEHKDGNANNLLGQTVVNYHNNSIANSSYNKYIGVVDEGGVLRITGNADASHAARIQLATPSSVLPSDPLKHSVNHIDIGIDGKADVTVPLAYGTYTYTDGNGTKQTIVVDPDHLKDVTLHAGKEDITVTADDMKTADIKAYKKSDYEQYKDNPEQLAQHELNDAFYITGYSANGTTAYSEVQVRVEGSFKVATGIDNADWRYYWDRNYQNLVKRQRLDNQVEYVLSLNKTVTLPVTIDGYQLYDGDGTPMTVTVTIPLKDSFSYWDRGNECPPVQWDWSNWQSGDVATHGMSGMDFRLDGGTVEVKADIVAINITKYIEDLDGNKIKVGSAVTNSFDVFRDGDGDPDTVKTIGEEDVDYNDYAFLHSKEVTIDVGSDQSIVHDYEVTPGMYYVRENPQSVRDNALIRDESGQEWAYKATEIQTEWVWREGPNIGMNDKGRLEKVHTSATYTGKEGDSYNAIPDVLGSYKNNAGEPEYNGFLEFYVINKYEKVQGEVPDPTEDQMSIQLDKKWDNNGENVAPDGDASVPFTLHQVRKTTTVSSGGEASGIKVVLYDWNGTSPLATAYANAGDSLSLSFTAQANKYANIQIKNYRPLWGDTVATWRHINGAYGTTSGDGIGTDEYGTMNSNITYEVDAQDIVDNEISFRLSPDNHSISGTFVGPPVWTGATGSGGGSTTVETVTDPEGSGYPKTVTLSNVTGWTHLFPDLPTHQTIPAEGKTIEYSYYLVEGMPTGSAEDFTKQEYQVFLDEQFTQPDEKNASNEENAITGRGVTKYVEITNKKASFVVEKQWRGEEEDAAYPPIKFQLYQGWKNGNGVSEGWLYEGETNHNADANHAYTISAEDGWKLEFYNLPTTATRGETTGDVGYYVKEVDPQDGSQWYSHVSVNYESATGAGSNSQPHNAGIGGNKGTITIINTPPTYTQINLIKKWYEYSNNGWSDITDNESKTNDYAFGFNVQRKVIVLDDVGNDTDEVVDYANYGETIIVSRNEVLRNENPFYVVNAGSAWNYRIGVSNDIATHNNNLVAQGYYQREDGTRAWARFEYRFIEMHAYRLSSMLDGETLKPEDQWETMPWNPDYESSDNQTTISNYPIGEFDVTKIWNSDDPSLEVGNLVYFKVYRDGADITPDIVANPSDYGLYSNQVHHEDGTTEHDAVVVRYDGTSWETVKLQGLQILNLDAQPSGTRYQYTIKEIGYSDKQNNDYWDVSAFLKGYMVDSPEGTPTSNDGVSPSVTADTPFNTVYIDNEYVKTETSVEFTKVWKDEFGEATGWKGPITVTLYQAKGDVAAGTDTQTGKTVQFVIDPYPTTGNGSEPNRTFTFDGKVYEWDMTVSHNGSYYTFKIDHLPYKNDNNEILSYYVVENTQGYNTSYAFENAENGELIVKTSLSNQDADNRALDGQYIINQELGVELPHTGGPGVQWCLLVGALLTVGASICLLAAGCKRPRGRA